MSARSDSTAPAILPRTAPDVPARVRRLVLALAAITAGTGALGTALSPYLLVEHPLVLIGLNPDSRHLVLVANRVELWQALLVGAARRGTNFIATFGLAAVYGHMLVTWLEKKRPWVQRVVRFVERLYAKLGVWLVVLLPVYWVAALAGAARLRLRVFVLATIPGQFAFVWGTLRFGEAIEQFTDPLIDWIAAHLVETTIACATAVVLARLWSRWRRRNRGENDGPDIPL